MGAGSETTTFAPQDSVSDGRDYTGRKDTLYYKMKVTPPGSIGYHLYELSSVANQGHNGGTFDKHLFYDSSSNLDLKIDYSPEDTTKVFRKYQLIQQVQYQASDSLVAETEYQHSSSNGMPELIREELRPFRSRGFTADPGNVDSFHRNRDIEYAFESHATGMNSSGTNQLSPIWKEVVREETRSSANGDSSASISANWKTFKQYNSTYYDVLKEWVWTGADAAADTSLPSDPTNTSEKVVVREVVSMDNYGHVTWEKDGEGRTTKYYYGDNSSNLSNSATGHQHRLLTGVRRLAGSTDDNSNDLITETDWDGDKDLVTTQQDENDSNTTYTYDDYWLPVHVKNHANTVVQRTDYSFARDQSGDDSFDSSKPNYVRTIRFFTYSGSTDSTHTTTFADGLNRKLQVHLRNGTNDIIQSWGYYTDGALRAEYTPYDIANSTHAYHNTAGYASRDSTKYEYESDPRRRPTKIIYPTMSSGGSRPDVDFSYSIATISGHKYMTRTRTDENNVAHQDWLHEDGESFKQTVASSYAARTWRDARGLAVMILPPRTSESTSSALRTDITQSPFGREIERDEPDQNATKTVYDSSLVAIYVQEAADASGNDFWATEYDSLRRPTRVGLEKDQSSSWYTRVPAAFGSNYGNDDDEWRLKYTYDSDQFGSGTTYPKARLTKVEGNYDTDATVEYYEWYQYAREGWITKTRTSVSGGVTKDTDYDYDTGGRLRKVSYATSENYAFYVWYDYDDAGRLAQIYQSFKDSKPDSVLATYAYNARGQVTTETYKDRDGDDRQTVDFTYSNRGFLTQINDPGTLGSDRFAMELGYDAKVTSGPSTNWAAENNGNISQIKWVNRQFNDTALYYTFNYDTRDQLTKADCSNDSFDVTTYSYDNNGNIATLNDGTTYTYNYDNDEANTNRLDDITNLTSDDNWDYDSNGRQTKDSNGSFSSATFHFPGAAFHDITMSGGTLQMRYDRNNQRVQKVVVSGTTTNYMRTIDGNVLAVFSSTTISERYVWGPLGLVAIIKGNNSSPTTYFTLRDHLGSIRAAVDSTGADVAGYDYYPYGKELRSDIDSGADSRFLFGAKEYDTELSLDLYYFEARFYRPDIGRFASPDPLRNSWSHYAYAKCNPLRYVDPSGLEDQLPPGAPPPPGPREEFVWQGQYEDGELVAGLWVHESELEEEEGLSFKDDLEMISYIAGFVHGYEILFVTLTGPEIIIMLASGVVVHVAIELLFEG
jgi:RHS repeat-associated protein